MKATADLCPVCDAVHDQLGDQIACGVYDERTRLPHGHRLLYYGILNGRFGYRCPGYRCQTVITAPRNPEPAKGETMTAIHHPIPAAPPTELAIRDGQEFWTQKQLAALRQLGIDGAANADLAVFMHRCQQTGLDPFSGQIYMIGRKTKDGVKQTIQVGVDGYRLIAKRAANRDGKLISYGPTVWFDGTGAQYPVWLGDGQPAAAMVTVYVDGAPFPGVARFKSFAQTNRDGKLIGLWETMGDHQIAKCAEVQALRRAFPHDLEGIHADIEQHDEPAGTPWHVAATAPAQRIRPEDVIDEVMEQISGHWQRLGVEDKDEQLNLAAAFAGVDPLDVDAVDDLPIPTLQRFAAQLKGCDEVGQVHALIANGDKP